MQLGYQPIALATLTPEIDPLTPILWEVVWALGLIWSRWVLATYISAAGRTPNSIFYNTRVTILSLLIIYK